MKPVTENQKNYIKRLSVKLYNLNNTPLLTNEQIEILNYHEADKIIKKLKKQVANAEEKLYLKPYVKYTDKLIEYPFVEYIENYKKIYSVIVDTQQNKAEIQTINGETIIIEEGKGKRVLFEYTPPYGVKRLFNIIKQAIDEDKRLNIYEVNNNIVAYKEDKAREENIKKYIKIINKILKATDNKLVKTYNEMSRSNEFRLDKMLPLIKVRNEKLYNELEPLVREDKVVEISKIFDILEMAERKSYGVVFVNDNVIKL